LDRYLSRLDEVRLSTVKADAVDRLEAIPVPTIAAIEGQALGDITEIAVASDARVMGDGASLRIMRHCLATSPAWGGGRRRPRLAGDARRLEWLAAGEILGASEALAAGLGNRITECGQALAEALSMARLFTANDPQAVRAVKRIVRAGEGLPPANTRRIECELFPDLWEAEPHREASSAFIARRNHRPQPT
jgi:enoyl-CoA hydratase/carnithine racemase